VPKPLCPPSAEPWRLTEDRFDRSRLAHFETIFTLANGYVGVRGSPAAGDRLAAPGTFLAGVDDGVDGGAAREIVNLPCWLGVRATMDGFTFDPAAGEVLAYRRDLDMRQGVLFARIDWRDAATRTTRFECARLVHRTRRHLALLWGRITALDYDGRLTLSSDLDAWAVKYASASGRHHFRDLRCRDLGPDGGLGLELTTRTTGIRVAMATHLKAPASTRRTVRLDDDRAAESLACPLRKGRPVAFEKRATFYTSREVADPPAAARQELSRLVRRTTRALVGEHTRAWRKVWDAADVRIDGDGRAQKAVRFNVFHLAALGAAHDDRVSIGAKGLHGVGYAGLVFWDTEIYMLPFFAYTQPPAARALLRYRHHLLPDARRNAREGGWRGARFPWTSSDVARERPRTGWQEHVGADIAFAADQYVQASGDRAFYLDQGAELILSTARYWPARVEPAGEAGRYVLRDIAGPDEIHTGIDNNAYTNHLVRWHLRRAARAAEDLRRAGRWAKLARRLDIGDDEPAAWRRIADGLYDGLDRRRGFHEQFQGYFRLREQAVDPDMTQMQYTGPVLHALVPTKLSKQADTVLMYYLFAGDFPAAMRRKAFRYYEPRCTHASSLSRSIHAAAAAQVGLTARARRLFLAAAELDFGPRAECESGIHAASLGGTWQAAVMGFGGFAVRDGRPAFDPHLPRQWKALAFNLRWRGKTLEVAVRPRSVRLRTRSGTIAASVAGRDVRVTTTGVTVRR
jgi:kojibiose phosphorylase